MRSCRPPLFRNRHFEPEVIVTCVRCYLRFCLSLRDLEELMAERGLAVDHTTIWRWTQAYRPKIYEGLRGHVKRKSSTRHIDETFVRIAGKWMYLFRAVDGHGQTVDFYLSETRDRAAAKLFLQQALANPDNQPPQVFARDGLRSYPAAIRELPTEGSITPRCRQRTRRYCNNRIESDHRRVKRRLRAMQGPRSANDGVGGDAGIEAAQIIRKGQVIRVHRATGGAAEHQRRYPLSRVFRALPLINIENANESYYSRAVPPLVHRCSSAVARRNDGVPRDHARLNRHELGDVASVQRQVDDPLLIDEALDRAALGVYKNPGGMETRFPK